MLEDGRDFEVVCGGVTAAEALARVPALRPTVAVLDVRLPDGDGVTVCREPRSRMPELACLMLTSFADEDALFDAIMAPGPRGICWSRRWGRIWSRWCGQWPAGSPCWTRNWRPR